MFSFMPAMGKFFVISVCIIFVNFPYVKQALLNNEKFRGAVVEYGAKHLNASNKDTVLLNVENYRIIIEELTKLKNPPDIIVFPECGLSSIKELHKADGIYGEVVPDPKSSLAIPCEKNYGEALKKLSCIAKNKSIYLVVNLIEKAIDNGRELFYNTNVVFDRQGALITRYRKYNIFGIDGKPLTKPKTPDFAYFDTDFGVRFGTFTCFDIIFKTPALDLIRHYNVTHIAFPTAWFSEQPFLTAVEEQSGWSYGSNAVLLASGYNDPKGGSTGSGIYFGNGDHESFIDRSIQSEDKADFAIVSWIPKSITKYVNETFQTETVVQLFNTSEKIKSSLKLKTDKLSFYTTSALPKPNNNELVPSEPHNLTIQTGTTITDIVCNRGLCCQFIFNKTTKYCAGEPSLNNQQRGDDFGRYKYRLAVFNGVRTYDYVTTGGVQVCSIISCLNNNGADMCGKRTDSKDLIPETITLSSGQKYTQCGTSFDDVTIRAKLKSYPDRTFLTAHILLSSLNDVSSKIDITRYGITANPELYTISKLKEVDDSTSLYELKTNGRLDNPITINLYNRVFDLDGSDMTENNSISSYNTSISVSVIFISFVTSIFIYYQCCR